MRQNAPIRLASAQKNSASKDYVPSLQRLRRARVLLETMQDRLEASAESLKRKIWACEELERYPKEAGALRRVVRDELRAELAGIIVEFENVRDRL